MARTIYPTIVPDEARINVSIKETRSALRGAAVAAGMPAPSPVLGP